MSAPDFHAMAARRVHGLPDGWLPRIYRSLGDARATIGFSLTGGVPLGVVTRGPRKGRPKFPPLRQLQEVIITYGDVKATREEWVAATGLCPQCGGDGQTVWRVSTTSGTEYRPCRACRATGKAQPLANDTTPQQEN